jgi:Tol biopolymer transport system component
MKLLRLAQSSVLCLLLAVNAHAQARQTPVTLSHELLWSFQRVGAPVPSPDGKWVVFSVSEPSYDPLKDVSDLWIVPADGSAGPRRLTSTKGTETGPAWSSDSTRIAFAAKRDDDEVNQIYVLEAVRGGEAQRVTADSGERAAMESRRPEDSLSGSAVAGRDR